MRERGAEVVADAAASPTWTSVLMPLAEQARLSCEAAARRYQDAAQALDQLAVRSLVIDESTPAQGDLRLRADAARLAWFHTVVHYERLRARRRRDPIP